MVDQLAAYFASAARLAMRLGRLDIAVFAATARMRVLDDASSTADPVARPSATTTSSSPE
jgi:hypothetical protein